jgi:hypothetical protein
VPWAAWACGRAGARPGRRTLGLSYLSSSECESPTPQVQWATIPWAAWAALLWASWGTSWAAHLGICWAVGRCSAVMPSIYSCLQVQLVERCTFSNDTRSIAGQSIGSCTVPFDIAVEFCTSNRTLWLAPQPLLSVRLAAVVLGQLLATHCLTDLLMPRLRLLMDSMCV